MALHGFIEVILPSLRVYDRCSIMAVRFNPLHGALFFCLPSSLPLLSRDSHTSGDLPGTADLGMGVPTGNRCSQT